MEKIFTGQVQSAVRVAFDKSTEWYHNVLSCVTIYKHLNCSLRVQTVDRSGIKLELQFLYMQGILYLSTFSVVHKK